jgi:hypothetical protein
MLCVMTSSSSTNAHHSPSLAARIGRWSTRHRGMAIAGWLAFVAIALFAGSAVGTVTPSDDNSGHGDSATADRIVDDAYPDRASETVLVQAPAKSGVTAHDPSFRATVNDVVRGVSGQPGVIKVKSPYGAGNTGKISADGRSALVTFEINGDSDVTEKRVDAVESAVKAAGDKHPQGPQQGLRRRLRAGRDALDPGHADHPRVDLRRAGRRGRPAAARRHRRGRDDRPARPDQPPRLAQRLHQRGRVVGGVGRRRRLLALLPAP